MKQIKLSTENIIESAGHSSKGNQPKWYLNGIWYKADHMGYEGLAEVLVSELLKKSNITDFVRYSPVQISFDDKKRNGCCSQNFLKAGQELIPLERLYRLYTGEELYAKFRNFDNPKDRIQYTVSFVEKVTDLQNVGAYLTAMIEIDALFLNEDRHTNNIAFLRDGNTKEFKFCPYFDFGLSLLSDLDGFWLDGDTDKHMLRVTAKPFGTFQGQLQAARELYGQQFLPHFTITDVENILTEFDGVYRKEILDRVKYVLKKQIEAY